MCLTASELPSANEGHLVAFSPRGDLLATDAGNQIRLWRTGTWDLVPPTAPDGHVQVFKFSPDGTRLASLSFPDEATVWGITDGPSFVKFAA